MAGIYENNITLKGYVGNDAETKATSDQPPSSAYM
jgi:hypothetical protein